MSTIRTNAAAAMLGVSPNTLRSWERRFSYPRPRRSEGGHRQFELAEIETLRVAFEQTQNISSAISIARERGAGMGSPSGLRGALEAYDSERADRLLEESMAMRSVERTVAAMLLPAVSALASEDARGGVTPEYGFAWRYATGWLAAALRVAPAATRAQGVMVFDASRPLQLDTLHVQALELFVRRAGLRVLTLPCAVQAARLTNALRALCPQAAVLSGAGASLDEIGRLVYAVRQASPGVAILDFRGALPNTGASMVTHLGDEPQAATQLLGELLNPHSDTPLRHSRAVPMTAGA